jgi:Pectate lyase superfamily protein
LVRSTPNGRPKLDVISTAALRALLERNVVWKIGVEYAFRMEGASMTTRPAFYNVLDFGAVGDGVRNDFPAFQKALSKIDADSASDPLYGGTGSTFLGAILFVPPGLYLLSQELRIERSIILQGAGRLSSALHFPLRGAMPSSGIVVDQGPKGAGDQTFPDATVIRDLRILRLNATPRSIGDDDPLLQGTSSGIVLRRKATIDNCLISGFEDDGIHINTSVGGGANANFWQITNCFSIGNGRHGLFVSGGDAKGCAINLFCQNNRAWAIYDRAPGGSTYISCYSENDGSGPNGGAFRTTPDNDGLSTFLGCAFESNQCQLVSGTIMIGGAHQGRVLRDPSSIGNHPLEPVNMEPDVQEGGLLASVQNLRVRGASRLAPNPILARDLQ